MLDCLICLFFIYGTKLLSLIHCSVEQNEGNPLERPYDNIHDTWSNKQKLQIGGNEIIDKKLLPVHGCQHAVP